MKPQTYTHMNYFIDSSLKSASELMTQAFELKSEEETKKGLIITDCKDFSITELFKYANGKDQDG